MTPAQELRGLADQLEALDASDHTTFLAIRGRLKQMAATLDGEPVIKRPKKAALKPFVDDSVIHYDFYAKKRLEV